MSNHRPYLRSATREMVDHNAQRAQVNEQRQIVDPNTGQVLDGKVQYGHVTGMENRGFVSYSNQAGMSQAELNNTTNNPGLYQLESPEGNMSHKSEEPDANATALNTANYCYIENPQYQKSTFINPPVAEGEHWTVSVVNEKTGFESQVGTFTPDLGSVTFESQGAVQSSVGFYSNQAYENSISDSKTNESNTDIPQSLISEDISDDDDISNDNDDDNEMTM